MLQLLGLRLLGAPMVIVEGEQRPWPRTRPGALLAYLACRHEWVARDELALLLRPDVPDAEARRYLRQVLHRAAAYPWAGDLEVAEDRVRWHVRSDLAELRAAIDRADGAALVAAGPPRPLLEGYAPPGVNAFDAWLELEREQVARAWCDEVVRHAQRCEEAGDLDAAIVAREGVLAVSPLEEATVQALMRACLRAGQAERALAAFGRFARALALDLDEEPLEATQALADAARRAPGDATPGSPRAQPITLQAPRPATGMVGRRHELARLRAWLEGDARWITVVGFGGVGKTRLVLELAQLVGPAFERGVCFVPLAPLGSVAEVLGAVASRLGVAVSAAPSALAIAADLGAGSLLLVLDEAEHLPAAELGSELVALLETVPRLRVVLTAREPLGVAAEHVLRLDGLASASGDLHDDAADDASALFYQRADRLGTVVLVADDTKAAVKALCRAVGGLPLAIELAAAQTRTRSVLEVLAEVEAGAEVLRTDAADVPARHRSVPRLVRQAWDALDERSRAALTRLMVFRAGCSLAGAQQVALADLDTVLTLLDRSLLRRVGADRFEVHELVRRAAPAAPDEDTIDAHARFVLAWLAGLTPELRGGSDQPHALDRVHAAVADVRSAWERALERGFVVELDAALVALDHAVHARNLWELAASLYRATVATFGGDQGPAADERAASLWLRVQVRLANIERNRSETESARSRIASVLAAAERRGDEPELSPERPGPEWAARERVANVPAASQGLARAPAAPTRDPSELARVTLEARLELGKLDEAVNAYAAAEHGYRRVLAAAAPGSDDDLVVQAHVGLANMLFAVGGDADEAMDHYETAVLIAKRLGDLDLLSITLINLGAGHFDLGRFVAARGRWREAAVVAARLGHRQREAVVLNNLGSLAETEGDVAGARDAFERSLALRLELGDRPGAARVLLNLGRLAQGADNLEEADAYLEASVQEYQTVDQPADLALALATHARVRAGLDDLPFARRACERALRLGRVLGDRIALLSALLAAATIQARSGQTERAYAAADLVRRYSEGRDVGVHASAQALLARLGAGDAAAAPGSAATASADAAVEPGAAVTPDELRAAAAAALDDLTRT